MRGATWLLGATALLLVAELFVPVWIIDWQSPAGIADARLAAVVALAILAALERRP